MIIIPPFIGEPTWVEPTLVDPSHEMIREPNLFARGDMPVKPVKFDMRHPLSKIKNFWIFRNGGEIVNIGKGKTIELSKVGTHGFQNGRVHFDGNQSNNYFTAANIDPTDIDAANDCFFLALKFYTKTTDTHWQGSIGASITDVTSFWGLSVNSSGTIRPFFDGAYIGSSADGRNAWVSWAMQKRRDGYVNFFRDGVRYYSADRGAISNSHAGDDLFLGTGYVRDTSVDLMLEYFTFTKHVQFEDSEIIDFQKDPYQMLVPA